MLEEQTSRNTLLEKKQRKFDAEIGLLNESKRHEETAKEKAARECEQLKANKFQLEDQIQVFIVYGIIQTQYFTDRAEKTD